MTGIAGIIDPRGGGLVDDMMHALCRGVSFHRDRWAKSSAKLGVSAPSVAVAACAATSIFQSKTLCVVLDGLILNRTELIDRLKRCRQTSAPGTDAELLAQLYEMDGKDFVAKLHGTYAFAIYDGGSLMLVRDRLGTKPLYYAANPGVGLFLFASEIKSLLQNPKFSARLDMQAFADFVVLGHPVGNATFIDGIRSVRRGHLLTVATDGNGRFEEQRYFKRAFRREERLSLDDAQERLELVLGEVIEAYVDSPTPVGVSLSGGLDSTLLALLVAEKVAKPFFTFTIVDDERNPDLGQASAVAAKIGSRHVPVMMQFDDFFKALPACIAAEEIPISGYSVASFVLGRSMASRVSGCLAGEGADEVFGGYSDYLNWESRARYLKQRLHLLSRLGRPPSDEAMSILDRVFSSVDIRTHLDRVFSLNLADRLERFRLHPTDRCARAIGVPMHLPYLDDRVVALAGRCPTAHLVRIDLGIDKYILRRLLIRRFGPNFLEVVLRRKLGAPSAGAKSLASFDALCNNTVSEDYLETHELGFCFESKRRLVLFEMFSEIFFANQGDCRSIDSVHNLIRVCTNRKATPGL